MPVQLRVFDVTGRQVYKVNSTTNHNLTFGQQLAPGIYMAEITRDGAKSTVKLMKE